MEEGREDKNGNVQSLASHSKSTNNLSDDVYVFKKPNININSVGFKTCHTYTHIHTGAMKNALTFLFSDETLMFSASYICCSHCVHMLLSASVVIIKK